MNICCVSNNVRILFPLCYRFYNGLIPVINLNNLVSFINFIYDTFYNNNALID